MKTSVETYRLAESELSLSQDLRSGLELTTIGRKDTEYQANMKLFDQAFGNAFIPTLPSEVSRIMTLGDWKQDSQLFDAMRQMSAFISERSRQALSEDSSLQKQISELRNIVHSISSAKDPAQATILKQAAVKELKTALERYEELPASDRDPFFAIHTKQIAQFGIDLQEGRIAKVPYVIQKKEAILSNLRQYKPVFLHGETGTGKTEVARLAAAEFSGKTAIVVRGYSGMDSTELFGHIALKKIDLAKASEIPTKIEGELLAYTTKHPEVKGVKLKEAKDQIISAVLSKTSATYSEYILGAVYNAIKNGQVVILDEANYIPPDLIAKLNDILTKKPGERVNIQEDGKAPIRVKEGFGVIMTGNINTDQKAKRYTHRFEIDTALLDRLGQGLIEYDFLPQAIEGKSGQYGLKDKQQYAVAVAALISSRNLKITENSVTGFRDKPRVKHDGKEHALDAALEMLEDLPNLGPILLPDGALEQVWNLAKFASVTQKIFTKTLGQNDDYSFQSNGVPVTIDTNRAITLRGMISIIEDWKSDGFTRELDSYLFDYLVAGKNNAREAALFYMNARAQGFFSTPGWDINDGYTKTPDTFKYKDPGNPAREIRICSVQEVVEFLFGEAPARTAWPDTDNRTQESVVAQADAAVAYEMLSKYADNCSKLAETISNYPFLKANLSENQLLFIELWKDKSACMQFFLSNQEISEEALRDEITRRVSEGSLKKQSVLGELVIGAGLISSDQFEE